MKNGIKTNTTNKTARMLNIKRFMSTLIGRKIVIVGIIGTSFFAILALLAPLIATHNPNVLSGSPGDILLGISKEHLLGTDYLGRDLFSRLVYGARVSILTGVIATFAATAIGTFLGMIAAYFGGITDKLLMGACETFNAIPQIAISMALISVLGGGMLNMALILCLGGIPASLRMMRASSLAIMNQDYIMSAKLAGQSRLKIMYKHVFPNSISPIIVMATQRVGMTIMMESGLSFLGVGLKIPTASWGSIINEARPYLLMSPLSVLAPCACLAVLIISLNLLGDGLRDALDPSLRGES
ncbi:ABC transporter permease [Lachnospiraceae bacterium OttesenSCG-928-D06]|nr:ABC transporter permease [Lachnospiraceae bacterium OttesenSCG-928-D06]